MSSSGWTWSRSPASRSASVADVQHHGQDLLVIEPGGVLVPFVAAIVPEVDVAAGLVIDPPPGLLELGPPSPAGAEVTACASTSSRSFLSTSRR